MHTLLESMDNEQIKRFVLFLFEENQNKSKQLDEMIARLDKIETEKPYRKGMIYNNSDYTMFPEGSVVISSSHRKIRNIVSHIEEHHFDVLKVKHVEGRIESIYLPMKDDARTDIYNEIMDIEYLCCLAHAKARFNYAYDQGILQARIFLELTAFSPPANPDES